MKFKDFKYIRPDFDDIKRQFGELTEKLSNSDSYEQAYMAVTALNKLIRNVNTMFALCHTRHSIDVNNEYYNEESRYVDSNRPILQGLIVTYYKILINHKYRKELQNVVGKHLFDLAEMNIKSFSPEVVKDLQEENKFRSEYYKLKSSAKIEFDGKVLNLTGLEPYMQSVDQNIRKRANEAYWKFFEKNEENFDNIYDNLVKIRHKIAVKLGFKNFIELGYIRLDRGDYDCKDVEKYRKYVLDYIVPLVKDLKDRQKLRLRVNKLEYYDIPLNFTSGNAKPIGNTKEIIEKSQKMFSDLSDETGEFFKYMVENELFDLESRMGKQGGGSCTFFHDYAAPFIFSNFNGTSKDIDVMTHEMGHAFQMYESRNYEIPEYVFPTREAAEIHSKSMEFMTWPWMNLFFGKDELKYKFVHLSEGLSFIPYGSAVDEFQHKVYENPQMTPKERRTLWRETEKKYMPYIDYHSNDFLERGGYWFKQGHVFGGPFYFIDYALAQICAFEFWIKFQKNKKEALNDYVRFCRAGGSQSFLELLIKGNLKSPFEEGTIESIVGTVKNWLDGVNDFEL